MRAEQAAIAVLVCVTIALGLGLYAVNRREARHLSAAIREQTAEVAAYLRALREQSIADRHEARLKALEDDLRVRRLESAPSFGFADTTGRELVSCAIPGDRRRLAIILTMGQSNAANHGSGQHYRAHNEVDNFNLNDGLCYHAVDPLLGASNEGTNFATRLGDLLIDQGAFDRVILVPLAMGGSFIQEWSPGGAFHRRIGIALLRLHLLGLLPDYVLWQHGEAVLPTGGVKEYTERLQAIVRGMRGQGVTAPVFVALSTTCDYSGPKSGPRQATMAAASNELGIYLGPDTDSLDAKFRQADMCHFNEAGVKAAAELWASVLLRGLPLARAPQNQRIDP